MTLLSNDQHVCREKTIKFRKSDLKMIVKNIVNLAGILLHTLFISVHMNAKIYSLHVQPFSSYSKTAKLQVGHQTSVIKLVS